tara:strand:- start:9137 stop:9409 length:273 start_codon:yes stop_codon:yes gene_type:complete
VKRNLNNLLAGLVVGGIIPPAVVKTLLMTTDEDLLNYSDTYFENVCLLAIGLNAGVMWLVLNKAKMDKMGRGILLANFAYVIAFVAYFYM